MAYFCSGTEGMDYQARWCERCVHDVDNNCPVWLAHILYAYGAGGYMKHVLNVLIPQSADGLSVEKCTMFVEAK